MEKVVHMRQIYAVARYRQEKKTEIIPLSESQFDSLIFKSLDHVEYNRGTYYMCIS